MKKMFGVVVVLLIIYIAFQVLYGSTVGRRTSSYKIAANGTSYEVQEVYSARHKTANRENADKNNYYYEIKKDGTTVFSFKTIGDYKGIEKFLNKLEIYEDDNVICMYPIFKKKMDDIDVTCNSNGKQSLYANLKGSNVGLDGFVSNLKTQGYSHPSWETINLETIAAGSFHIYRNNIVKGQNITLWQYKGFYRITNISQKFISTNNNDQYEPNLTAMVNQYYVVPDYKSKTKFTRLFVTNLISGTMIIMDLGVEMPYNSLVQGVVDNKIYYVDCSNKIQYAVDIYDEKVEITGDLNNSTKFYDKGKWNKKSIYEVVDNNLKFIYDDNIPENLTSYAPIFTGQTGGETDGYYYLCIKEKNEVGFYRVDKQNSNILTLLFRVPTINRIKFIADDIYFVSNDTLYSYQENLGLRPLIKYNEFIFNSSDLYNVYIDE